MKKKNKNIAARLSAKSSSLWRQTWWPGQGDKLTQCHQNKETMFETKKNIRTKQRTGKTIGWTLAGKDATGSKNKEDPCRDQREYDEKKKMQSC